MSEASYLVELREAAPRAPEALRELVRELPPTKPARAFPPLRPLLVGGIGIAVAVAVGAAAISGIHGGRDSSQGASSVVELRPTDSRSFTPQIPSHGAAASKAYRAAPGLTAPSRLQSQDVSMSMRVKDLSGATQSAVRTTRRLGGFVAGADYSTDTNAGVSRLTLRVPVANLQNAIASFTTLGTILSQHISVADLQAGVDRLDKRIANARRAGDKDAAARFLRRRAALVREGTYARVSLNLTTTKPAAKHVVPSRFDRFRDNAGDILGKEAIGVLYFLVIAGPFIFLAALALFGERARRRRADHRLLEETG
jgi:Domain of unknown function (DUF4349)